MYKRLSLLLLLFVSYTITPLKAQDKQAYKAVLVGFYNLENIFDTIDDPNKNDEEFLPDGKNAWNTEKYLCKLKNMSEAIASIGTDFVPEGVSVLGLSEVENRNVLEDLVAQPAIEKRNYQIIHYEGPDRRGVDVAMIYNPRYFKPTNSKAYRTVIPDQPDFFTRDQLVVSGMLDGELMHFIVMHWPSRFGGEKASRPNRIAAASLCRHIADSLIAIDPNAKVVMMGDYNDYPTNVSVTKYLRGAGNMKKMKKGDFFNPMFDLHKSGIGSNYYRDVPGVLDQMVITPGLLPTDFETYQFKLAKIHNKDFLKQHGGRYDGYPFRTFSGAQWIGGYSDHFPVYIILTKKSKYMN